MTDAEVRGVEIVRVDPVHPDPAVIGRAARLLADGGLVAFPTETVYGLGANALDQRAVASIYEAKGRPSYNPIIAHLPDAEAVRPWVADWPVAAEELARRFWPGPLTLVLPRRGAVAEAVTAGLDTLAVRVPSHPVARAVLGACDFPVAAPSANLSTRVSPTTGGHVARGLEGRVGLILDGGPTPVGIESTVVSLVERPALLRPGIIAAAEIEAVTGPLDRPAVVGDAPRPSPGMMDRHYAPRAEVRLFGQGRRDSAAAEAEGAVAAGAVVGALLLESLDAPVQHPFPMPPDPAGYARLLYAALHALDEAGCHLILVEEVPPEGAWEGVRDRIRRAATP